MKKVSEMTEVELCEQFLPLAHRVASRACVRYRGLPFEQAFSDSLFGLFKAARNFKPAFPFVPYAQKCCAGEILRGIRDRSAIRRREFKEHEKPTFTSLDEMLESQELRARELSPYEELEIKELWDEVDKLPERQRVAIRLSYQGGIPQKQIGELMGVSQMQACRYIKQGTEALAEVLAA